MHFPQFFLVFCKVYPCIGWFWDLVLGVKTLRMKIGVKVSKIQNKEIWPASEVYACWEDDKFSSTPPPASSTTLPSICPGVRSPLKPHPSFSKTKQAGERPANSVFSTSEKTATLVCLSKRVVLTGQHVLDCNTNASTRRRPWRGWPSGSTMGSAAISLGRR